MPKPDQTELAAALEAWQQEQGALFQENNSMMPQKFRWYLLAPYLALAWCVAYVIDQSISYFHYRDYIDEPSLFAFLASSITPEYVGFFAFSLISAIVVGVLVGWFTRGKPIGVFVLGYELIRYFLSVFLVRPWNSAGGQGFDMLALAADFEFGTLISAWWGEFLMWAELQFENPTWFLYFGISLIITYGLMYLYVVLANRMGSKP